MLRKAHRASRLVLAAALGLLLAAPVLAGTTGKLTGTVRDEKKQPLAGVNIRVVGQRLGAVTDETGQFVIIGIPGGLQSVQANLLGYAAYTASNVSITPDFTTELNITLRTEAVQMSEVKVEAERPLLQKDATSTTRFISADQIQKSPTRGYQDAAAQQAGVVNFQRLIDRESSNSPTLIIRGGRPNETAYFVDGFSQQDPLTGNSTTSINNNAIEEVVVLNGGFNAEYGRIMSGVVNVITKGGGSSYSGSIEGLSDNLGGVGDKFLGTRVYDYNLYDANLGGPIIKGKDFGTFYFSGQRRWQRDRAPRSNYNSFLPSNTLGGITGQGKLLFPLGEHLNLNVGALASDDDWQEYRNAYRFDLAHSPRYEDRNRSLTGSLSHTLNAKTFYNLGVSFFSTERKRGDGLFFDDLTAYNRTPNLDYRTDIPWFYPGFSGNPGDPLSDSLAAAALAVPGSTGTAWDDYLHRKSEYLSFKGDMTSQINAYHQLKFGGQYDLHTLRFYQNYFPTNFSPVQQDIDSYGFGQDGNTESDSGIDGPRKPRTAGAYLQDKYERSGLVVNAGVRFDYINVNADALKNENNPLGDDGQLTAADLTESKTYSRISPRIGVGFPVTDRMVLHANWGQFFQQPNLQDLYVSYRFLEYKVQTGQYFVPFGNPNLKPEQTTAYEVGIAQQMNDYAKFDLSVYYKDVRDLVQIASIPVTGPGENNFSSFRNKDFATIKGVDFGFTLRRINHIAANVAYSLSFAKGTGSVSNTQRNVAWTGGDPPRQTAPLDFDQRHKISVNLDYALGKGEGTKVGNWTPFSQLDVNVLYNVASGTPYTPTTVYDEVTQGAVNITPVGPLNSRALPWTQSLDFKATKRMLVSNLNVDVYAWVINAFDADNVVNVFTGTGSAATTGYLSTPEGQALTADLASKGIDATNAYRLAQQGSALFNTPRTIRFGLRVGF